MAVQPGLCWTLSETLKTGFVKGVTIYRYIGELRCNFADAVYRYGKREYQYLVDNNRPLIYGSTTRITSEILNGSG